MEILLNGEKLDIQFEHEKFLGEVLSGIANWLKADGYYLKEFRIDGEPHAPTENFAEFRQDFSAIQKLELDSAESSPDLHSMMLESLKTLCDCFEMASSAFEDGHFAFLQDFFSSPEPLLELLERSVAEEHQGVLHELRQTLSEWGYFQSTLPLDSSERMQAALQNTLQVLIAVHSQYTPTKYSASIKFLLEDKKLELEQTVVQLQSGQMQQCLLSVSDLSLLLEELLKGVQQKSKIGELFVQLKPFLQELSTAIEETDIVTIGDLVEYEIIPLIQQIIDELD